MFNFKCVLKVLIALLNLGLVHDFLYAQSNEGFRDQRRQGRQEFREQRQRGRPGRSVK